MPAGDRTGPSGMGPMTGRAAGYCAGNDMPGYMNPVYDVASGAAVLAVAVADGDTGSTQPACLVG